MGIFFYFAIGNGPGCAEFRMSTVDSHCFLKNGFETFSQASGFFAISDIVADMHRSTASAWAIFVHASGRGSDLVQDPDSDTGRAFVKSEHAPESEDFLALVVWAWMTHSLLDIPSGNAEHGLASPDSATIAVSVHVMDMAIKGIDDWRLF